MVCWARATGHVTSEAGRLFRYGSLQDLRTSRAGSPGGFFAERTTLYVKFSDGLSPSRHVVHAARLDQAFVLDGVSFVGIDNVEIRHYGGAAPGVGVLLRNCLECVVHKTRIHEVQRAGVWVEGGERGRIEDNEIWDTSIAEWTWHQTNLSSADNHGIFFDGLGSRGFIIRRNHVWGLFDGIAPCGSTPDRVANDAASRPARIRETGRSVATSRPRPAAAAGPPPGRASPRSGP